MVLFFVLLGCVVMLLGVLLLYGGKLFYAIARLVQMAGGDVEPHKGTKTAWFGIILILVGFGLIYITMKLSR